MPERSFIEYADEQRPVIEMSINRVFSREQRLTADYGADYRRLLAELTKLVRRGGKRLRPLLYMLAYEGYAGKQPRAARQVAAGLELIHAFLLIHDDIIDRDYHRWGGHNIIGVYFERYSQRMDAREALHASQSQALLAGDICLSLALRTIGRSGLDSALQLAEDTQTTVLQVIAGELMDMSQSNAPKLPTEADILSLHRLKTASYSFGLPLKAAAISAGRPEELPLLNELAEHLGIAYQLQDDILSMFGDPAKTGKSAAGDLYEHKRTLLLVKALADAPAEQARQLRRLYNKKDITAADVAAVQAIMTSSGALDYVQAMASQHLAAARRLIGQTALAAPQKQLFADCIDALDRRRR